MKTGILRGDVCGGRWRRFTNIWKGITGEEN